jgi:trk system potassium uptake protein
MSRQVMVVGGGRLGAALAALLCEGGHRVTLLDSRPEVTARLADTLEGVGVIQGGESDPEVLRRAGARDADAIAAVTSADERNLVVASLARFEFAVPHTIARINDPANAWMYRPEMGVDVALNQADLMAHLVVEELSLGEMTTLLKLRRGQYALVEERIRPDALAASRPLSALSLPAQCALVAVLREGAVLLARPDLVLRADDEVLAIVHTEDAERLAAVLGPA